MSALLFPQLTVPEPFRCIVADPAWAFGDRLPGVGRGAEKHYEVASVQDICAMATHSRGTETPSSSWFTMCDRCAYIADDAHLFLWRVAAMQQEALDVARAWGFTVKSELVWLKRTKKGKRHFGMGRHVRMEHEVCLICTRGRGAGVLNRSTRSTFVTGLHLDDDGGGSFDALVGEHSQKPAEFFEIVESLVPGPRLELFARTRRPGWTCLGNEITESTPGARG